MNKTGKVIEEQTNSPGKLKYVLPFATTPFSEMYMRITVVYVCNRTNIVSFL